jgi:hypothetical protein
VTSTLDNLTGFNGPLAAESPDQAEFSGLIKSAVARLKDAANDSLALESQFDLAYNAAHGLCLAALRWHGYRAQHRYIVFQVLPHTLGLGPEVWRILAMAHDKRNLGEYEGYLDIDSRFVTDLVTATQAVAEAVKRLPDASSRPEK